VEEDGEVFPTIAVIDDDAAFRELMALLLDEAGCAMLPYASGEAALAALEGMRPAALVIDLRLGSFSRIDGLALLDRLQWEPNLRAVPILVCSADAPALERHAPSLIARGHRVLEKPFDIDELLGWLRDRVGILPEGDPAAHGKMADGSVGTHGQEAAAAMSF
jgi:CheY-like chemotaxis protein